MVILNYSMILLSQELPARDWRNDINFIFQAFKEPWLHRLWEPLDFINAYFPFDPKDQTNLIQLSNTCNEHNKSSTPSLLYNNTWTTLVSLNGLEIDRYLAGGDIQLKLSLDPQENLADYLKLVLDDPSGVVRILGRWSVHKSESSVASSNLDEIAPRNQLNFIFGWDTDTLNRPMESPPGFVEISILRFASAVKNLEYRKKLFNQFLTAVGASDQAQACLDGDRFWVERASGPWGIKAHNRKPGGPTELKVFGFSSSESLAATIEPLRTALMREVPTRSLVLDLTQPTYERLRSNLMTISNGRPWEVNLSLNLGPAAFQAITGTVEKDSPERIPLVSWIERLVQPDRNGTHVNEMRLVKFHADLVRGPSRQGYQLELSCNAEDGLELLRERATVLPDLDFS